MKLVEHLDNRLNEARKIVERCDEWSACYRRRLREAKVNADLYSKGVVAPPAGDRKPVIDHATAVHGQLGNHHPSQIGSGVSSGHDETLVLSDDVGAMESEQQVVPAPEGLQGFDGSPIRLGQIANFLAPVLLEDGTVCGYGEIGVYSTTFVPDR